MQNQGFKKVGNTSFQVEAIKKMKLKGFKETYGKILKGQDLDKVYEEVTGEKASPKDEPKKEASK